MDRTMTKANQTRTYSRVPGRFAWIVTILALVTLSGCAVRTVSVDATPTVSQARAKLDLGIDFLRTGRTAMAIRHLRASLDLEPNDAQTYLWLGEAYRRKGQNEIAEEYLRKAVAMTPRLDDMHTTHEAMLNLSALLSQLGRYEESLEFCAVLAEDPTVATPWRPLTNCGWALMKLGRLDEARAHFVDALDFYPKYGAALLNLGILEAKQGHRLAAVKTFERSLDRLGASGKAEVHYRLGELFVALGRRDKAVPHFEEAVKEAPDLDWGSQSQAYLDLLH